MARTGKLNQALQFVDKFLNHQSLPALQASVAYDGFRICYDGLRNKTKAKHYLNIAIQKRQLCEGDCQTTQDHKALLANLWKWKD